MQLTSFVSSTNTDTVQTEATFLPHFPTLGYPTEFERIRRLGFVNHDMQQANQKIAKLEQELQKLKDDSRFSTKMVLIREVAYPDAKREIEQYIKTRKTTDLEKIQDDLQLDLSLIVSVVKELEKENTLQFRE